MLVGAVVLVTCSSLMASVTKEYDHFKNQTTLHSTFEHPAQDGAPVFVIFAGYKGKVFSGKQSDSYIMINISFISSEWRYLDCNDTHWLVDGKPISLPSCHYDGSVGDGYVLEQLSIIPIKVEDAEKLASAHTIEVEVCNDEYQLNEMEKSDLREIVTRLSKGTETSPPVVGHGTSSEVLTNATILDLVKAGLTEELIVAKIRSTPANFDTTAQSLIELKKEGVPQKVIAEMLHKDNVR